MLLTLPDLPNGWQQAANEVSPITGEEGYCGNTGWFDIAEGVPMAQATFLMSDFGPYLGEGIHEFSSESEASAAMDYWREQMNCEEWTDSMTGSTGTVTDLDVTAAGDDKMAKHVAYNIMGMALETDMVIVRIKQYVIQVIHGAFGTVDAATTQDLVNRAMDKAR